MHKENTNIHSKVQYLQDFLEAGNMLTVCTQRLLRLPDYIAKN